MFMDETLETVGTESSWRKSNQSEHDSRGCQTVPLETVENGVQAVCNSECGTQTEPDESPTGHYLPDCKDLPDPPGLTDFLQRIEDTVVKELAKNAQSHAFDGFQVNWEERHETVLCAHRLHHRDAQERGLHVTSLSWNCTGSVIACGFGRVDDGDWSMERAFVCTWNLERRGMDPGRPDIIIDTASAVMCLAFHPSHPSFITGGLYSGEVVVWDTSRSQDIMLAQTGMSEDTHRDPVYQVHWVSAGRRGEWAVLSAGTGGRVLLWNVGEDGRLALSTGYALLRQQVPHSGTLGKVRGSGCVGVTSLALSPWDPDVFLAGSEGGLLLKCSFSTRTMAATATRVTSEGEGVTLHAPARFSFSPRCGPVHTLHCSPFHRNLFLSAGTDGLAHLHSVLQAEPLLSLRVCDSYVFAVRWSPTRPLLFTAATAQGTVQIFHLDQRLLHPVASIDQATGGRPTFCLEFNPQQPCLLAAGNADGTVNIWRLSAELTEQGPRETAQLEQLANELAE
ncbi:hypothetical protein SKAU_G00278960 [Synaphobranchus kaupii]|uniref:WD repeat-containing protein 34 n=1 Tax=Synaphobranchus kaupii TaxID=118154 RepID=A0A9Q1INS8_SYNKA|nr:hypothetical protein SKAU_G00278960 [Synaphobranchus kaupii]